jgi:monooxygenase
MSVLALATEDEAAQREFVAGWTLTMRNLARGVREPLRPEEVRALAGSEDFRAPGRDGRTATAPSPAPGAPRPDLRGCPRAATQPPPQLHGQCNHVSDAVAGVATDRERERAVTAATTLSEQQHQSGVEHLDVLVVGAGLSGIGAAVHLQQRTPGRSYAILEAREALGGTWDLFRYPGIRSDSDMFTLGYSFRPWLSTKGIADGPAILDYVRDTAREFGVDRAIRYGHRVVRAEWSSEDARWTVTVERTDTGSTTRLTCGFLFMCSGYYRYDQGYTPELPGAERFTGQLVHPQHWPEDLDYTGKRVVVIGSGATAVTLVPAMAEQAAHVTMLQRTPTYIARLPAHDLVARALQGRVSDRAAYSVVRWKNILRTMWSYQLSRRKPQLMKKLVRLGLEKSLPKGFDIDTHFTPPYDPWDQRFCVVPDGDLFRSLRAGTSSVVTGTIDTFTDKGIRLQSGEELEADVVVTATGLQMLALGGTELVVDGAPVKMSETVGYKGMMFSGVPNLAAAIGYTNASWTLKCDLVCEYVCGLLNHMHDAGFDVVTPQWTQPQLPDVPFVDLMSGYVLRSVQDFPKQGEQAPWRLHQNYVKDLLALRHGRDPYDQLEFRRLPRRQPGAASGQVV